MKELGISGRKVKAGSGLDAVHPPAMLFIFAATHAVVFARMTGGRAEIWNPSDGKAFLTESRLRQMWDGHALEFERARN
jgi:ABC-type bacteriocin/lantibiotic exporter with double-glycine peptidase domain